jgi:adenosylmethionine-8-amino-7-oxononanoate aminotransferase
MQEPHLDGIPEDPVWYPFTQMQEHRDAPPLSIVQGEGRFLIDSEGNRYLDGVSSLWCNVHGHRHPEIDAAVRDQLGRIAHSTMLGLTHPWGQELARRLVRLAPGELTRVFYSDSGATATEIALKMAYQYWQLVGRPDKTRFLRLTNAYHGDTVGAVSIGGIDLFHDRFRDLIFETVAVPSPSLYRHPWDDAPDEAELCRRYLAEAESLIETHAPTAAAFVIEPLLQGAAGMVRAPEGYLRGIRDLTRAHDLLLIADEVAVGFGRTGRMFACEWEGVRPDLLCLAKGISAGYLPLAATLATETVFQAFLGQYAEAKTFYHGHTYTGNPLGCAAALASLDVFENERTLAGDVFGPKAARYAEGMARLAALAHVGDTRFHGLMGGVELVRDKTTKAPYPFAERMAHRVVLEARKRGVIVRPLGDVLILLPPLAITVDELDLLFHVVEESIRAATED